MICLLAIVAMGPVVPGAVSLEHIAGVPIRWGRIQDSSGLSVISDDGQVVFVHVGKFIRYRFDKFVNQGYEDIFYSNVRGKPQSLTSSQAAHTKFPDESLRVEFNTRRVVGAPSLATFFVGAELENRALRLTTVNIDKRGDTPNKDIDVQPFVEGGRPQLLSAFKQGNSTVWDVLQPGKGDLSRIVRLTWTGDQVRRRNLGFAPAGSWDDYDPDSGLLVGNRPDSDYGTVIVIARRNEYAAVRTRYPQSREYNAPMMPFIWRGKVFAQNERLRVRTDDGDWVPFGSDFVVLAVSSNEKYWLVADRYKQAWKVTF